MIGHGPDGRVRDQIEKGVLRCLSRSPPPASGSSPGSRSPSPSSPSGREDLVLVGAEGAAGPADAAGRALPATPSSPAKRPAPGDGRQRPSARLAEQTRRRLRIFGEHPFRRAQLQRRQIGIAREPYRWAELEQLVYSPSRWERRLVGSTVATMPHVDRRRGRDPQVAAHGLELIGELIGDAQPDVQKALAWALRSLAAIDLEATTTFLDEQATQAVRNSDGHRAWVVRDALPKIAPADADRLRARLDGIRRRPGARSTSRAAEAAARFDDGRLGMPMPEPPLA